MRLQHHQGKIYDVLAHEEHNRQNGDLITCYLIGSHDYGNDFVRVRDVASIMKSALVYHKPGFPIEPFNRMSLSKLRSVVPLPYPYYRWIYSADMGEGKPWSILPNIQNNQDALSLTEVE